MTECVKNIIAPWGGQFRCREKRMAWLIRNVLDNAYDRATYVAAIKYSENAILSGGGIPVGDERPENKSSFLMYFSHGRA